MNENYDIFQEEEGRLYYIRSTNIINVAKNLADDMFMRDRKMVKVFNSQGRCVYTMGKKK